MGETGDIDFGYGERGRSNCNPTHGRSPKHKKKKNISQVNWTSQSSRHTTCKRYKPINIRYDIGSGLFHPPGCHQTFLPINKELFVGEDGSLDKHALLHM